MPAVDSQGIPMVFAGVTYECDNIDGGGSVEMKDSSHTGQARGSYKRMTAAPLLEARDLTIDYWGTALIVEGSSGTLSCGAFTGNATCMSSNLTYAAGELQKGKGVFKFIPS